MMVSIFGVILFRIFWMFCIYPHYLTLENLYFCYSVSWTLVLVGQFSCYFIFSRRFFRAHEGLKPGEDSI